MEGEDQFTAQSNADEEDNLFSPVGPPMATRKSVKKDEMVKKQDFFSPKDSDIAEKVFHRAEEQKSLTQKKAQRMLNSKTNVVAHQTQEFRSNRGQKDDVQPRTLEEDNGARVIRRSSRTQ